MLEDQEPVQNLLKRAQELVRKELAARSKWVDKVDIDFENKVWMVVHALKPDSITVGRDPSIVLEDETFRPDIFAVFDTCALVVECRYTDSAAFLSDGVARLRDAKRGLQSMVRRQFDSEKLVSIFAVKSRTSIPESLLKQAHGTEIKIFEEREVDYYLRLMSEAGIGISQQFWARMAPSVLEVGEHKEVPAIQIREGKKIKYIFSVNAHELLKRTLISHPPVLI